MRSVCTASADELANMQPNLGNLFGRGSVFGFDGSRHRDRRRLLTPASAWVAFIGGARRCLGADFAITELDIVLRTVLQNFRIQTDDAADEKSHFRGIAHTPRQGGRVVVNRRT